MEVQSDHTGDMENLKLATETDRFGFVLGNGITVGDGPSPVLVRHREVKWLSIISNWDDISQRRSSKVKGQCQKGIPASLRAKCWPMLCGATRRMSQNPNLYKTLDESPASQSWVDVIERDTDRQFPFHEMFLSKDGLGQRELFRVLKIYTQFRPDEGYCQAQGPVAAVLLMNMPAEEAFWCLAQISEIYLPGYYSPLLEGVLFDAGMLPWVLKRACPAAHRHLQRQGVEPLMFATDWLMCLYTRHLPFNTLLRVWDLFFCYGVRVLFQVAVVLVRRVLGRGDQREQCDGQMETLERLRGVKDYLKPEDSDIFIQEVCSVSLSERDLQRRAERELEKWRKERPNSTYDPRHRCHGYLMACERVKEMEECKERQEKVKGNLSLPLVHRSASSLSPSLLRKRWKKRGSRLSLGSQCEEESADVQRGFEVEKRKSSTSSVNGAQRCAEESHHNTITPNSCHSELERPSTSASGAGTTSTGSEQFQEHRHLEEDIPAPEPAPTSESESDGPAQRSGQEMGQTDCNIEKGLQEMHTEDEESRTVKDEQTEEAEEDVQPGDRVRDTAKSDSEAQLITEDSDTVVEAEEIEAQVVDEEAGGIQVMQEEESKVKITDEEIQPENIEEELMVSVTIKNKEIQLEDTQEGQMVSVQETSEREVEVVEDVEQQETRGVTDIQEEPTSEDQQGEIVSQAEHKDEKHDHLDSDDVQMSVGQNEWEGQEQNEVTGTESRRPDNDYDLHKGEQTESLPMQLIRSRQSVVEEEEVETTPPKETTNDDKCLNSDLTHPQPQCSLNTSISPETQSPQTDEGPSILEGDQASFSTLHDTVTLTDSKVLTTTPVSESQEQPQEMEVKTEAEGALEGHPERRAQTEMAGHMEEMEEMRTEGVQEEASVNTQPPTTSTGSCSASSGRPGLQTDRSAFIVTESVVDDGGEHTLTEQLTPPPPPPPPPPLPPPPHVQSASHSATQDTLHDTSTTQNAVQLHQKLECSRPHRSQVDGETKDHTETVVDKMEDRPDVDSGGKPPDSVEETTSDLDPLTVSRSDLHESQGHSEPEKAEMCVKGEHICDQEQAVTSCPCGGLNSKTQDGIEKDHVAPLNIPHTEPTQEGTMGTDTEGTMGTDTEGTMGTDTEGTMGTDTEGTMGTDTEGIMGTDKETTMETIEEGTMGTDPEKTMETGTEGTMGTAPEGSMTAEPPLSTCAPVHRRRSSTSSRNSYPTVLSKDIFISPKETTQHDYTPAQPSQTDTQQPPTSPSDLELETPTTLPASHSSNPSQTQKQTLSPADKRTKQTDGSKRIGIFQRLRGAKGSNTSTSTPKITIPKILIQDFSEEAEEDEKLTSKERRRRKREKEKKEKEEERLRKKQEKEMEKERDRERKKPQTRGKSFQLPSSPMRGKDGTIRRSDSQTVVSRRNSTPLSENYF